MGANVGRKKEERGGHGGARRGSGQPRGQWWPTTHMSSAISDDLLAKVATLAEESGRSRSWTINQLLDEALRARGII